MVIIYLHQIRDYVLSRNTNLALVPGYIFSQVYFFLGFKKQMKAYIMDFEIKQHNIRYLLEIKLLII